MLRGRGARCGMAAVIEVMQMNFSRFAYVAAFVLSCSTPMEALSQGVQSCKSDDVRTPIVVWNPEVNEKGQLSSEPPTGDGRIVYIEFTADEEKAGCLNAKPDQLYSFTRPTDLTEPENGGLAVNFRGNVQFANSMCTFSGFYMNEPVFGMHQGWIETYFGAVDKFKIVSSGNFCISR